MELTAGSAGGLIARFFSATTPTISSLDLLNVSAKHGGSALQNYKEMYK